MKLIYILISALILCNIATASMEDLQPYTIRVIVWDTDDNRESDVPVTFAYAGQSETLYSAEDGTLSFSLLNFNDVHDGAHINVSCKHGAKDVLVNYTIGATGVTYNEPSEEMSITAFMAMGFATVISLGGGIYYLIRGKKKKDENQ